MEVAEAADHPAPWFAVLCEVADIGREKEARKRAVAKADKPKGDEPPTS